MLAISLSVSCGNCRVDEQHAVGSGQNACVADEHRPDGFEAVDVRWRAGSLDFHLAEILSGRLSADDGEPPATASATAQPIIRVVIIRLLVRDNNLPEVRFRGPKTACFGLDP